MAVSDHGGISHAAERLRIAQPAVSRQIRDLELELGIDLLRREGRRVVLTDAGLAFAERARAILASVEEASQEAKQIAKGEAGELRIGLLESASWAGHLPVALNRFAQAYPNLRLKVVPLGSVAQIDAIVAGDIDAGFVYRQDSLNEDLVSALHLRTDNVVLSASTDLVFDHEGPLELEDIDGLPMISFPRAVAPAYHDQLTTGLDSIGLHPTIVQEADNETTILSLVSAGVGCAFVNSSNMERPPRNVQFRRVKGLDVPIEFLFITRKPAGDLAQRLADVV
ncbi:MAG: LysR family transcriptional regulator, partial [Pseudomonadota bacterium]